MWRIVAALAVLVGLALGYEAFVKHQQGVGYQLAVSDFAKKAEAIDTQREAIAEPIVTKQEAAQVQIRTVTKTLIKEIPRYVTTNDCPGGLSAGFGRLHDAAALGHAEVPDAAAITDDPAVPAQDAIGITIENYGIANANAERLRGLQEWVRAQEALN